MLNLDQAASVLMLCVILASIPAVSATADVDKNSDAPTLTVREALDRAARFSPEVKAAQSSGLGYTLRMDGENAD